MARRAGGCPVSTSPPAWASVALRATCSRPQRVRSGAEAQQATVKRQGPDRGCRQRNSRQCELAVGCRCGEGWEGRVCRDSGRSSRVAWSQAATTPDRRRLQRGLTRVEGRVIRVIRVIRVCCLWCQSENGGKRMAAAPKHMQPKLPRVMGQKQQGNTTPASHRVTAARGSDRHSGLHQSTRTSQEMICPLL